jgi:hypothetical protein
VSDILVSIIESIADAAATAKARRVVPPAPRSLVRRFTAAPAPQSVAPPVVAPPSAARLPASEPVSPPRVPAAAPRVSLAGLFSGEASILRAVVAAEVLSPPVGLRARQNLWDPPGV